MKIALLEDDLAQAEMVCRWLEDAGHTLTHFERGGALLEEFARHDFNFLIFDWQLPDRDGIDVLSTIRQNYDRQIPILFTTQRDSEQDIVRALEQGADDYLVKPLRHAELLARVTALGRRAGIGDVQNKIVVGNIVVDKVHGLVMVEGKEAKLTDKEYQLALCLLENEGRLLSREFLLRQIWGLEASLNTRTVDIHVSRVRRELKIGSEMGYRIKTVYQHGYRFAKI